MKRRQTLGWGLFSLLMFWLINCVMSLSWLTINGRGFESGGDLLKTSLIALVLFSIPLIIIYYKSRLGYYLMAIVQIIYLIGYVGAITMLLVNNRTWSPLVSTLLVILIALAIGVTLYWLYLAWQVRKATQKERLAHYMKIRDVEMKKDKKNGNG